MSMSPSHSNEVPERLSDMEEPVFQAPWEARAFAIVNQLAQSDYYSWSEWTEHLVGEIAATEQTSPGSKTYYEQWVAACEKLLTTKGLLNAASIDQKVADLLAERATEHDH